MKRSFFYLGLVLCAVVLLWVPLPPSSGFANAGDALASLIRRVARLETKYAEQGRMLEQQSQQIAQMQKELGKPVEKNSTNIGLFAGKRQTIEAGGETFAMRYIPAGSFTMGSGRGGNESPQRTVQLSKGFWMLETEVTQGQYKALIGSNPSHFQDCDLCPVEMVSWHEARDFANKLSKAQGLSACTDTDSSIFQCQGWRLPTEAEWEYAARAGTTGLRYGNLHDIAWHSGNSHGTTRSVRGKLPNAWGLYDMIGNVWEWVLDNPSTYPNSAQTNPLTTPVGDVGVIRSGSWGNAHPDHHSARRHFHPRTLRHLHVGFRVVKPH